MRTAGNGSAPHLAAALLSQVAGFPDRDARFRAKLVTDTGVKLD